MIQDTSAMMCLYTDNASIAGEFLEQRRFAEMSRCPAQQKHSYGIYVQSDKIVNDSQKWSIWTCLPSGAHLGKRPNIIVISSPHRPQ